MSPTLLENALVYVFTFKDGLLSRVAHDLRLSVLAPQITVDGDTIDARIKTDAFQVDGAMQRGQLKTHVLSTKDKGDVLDNISREVLYTRRYPEIIFQGRYQPAASGWAVAGNLTLVGRTRPLSFTLVPHGTRMKTELTLTPSQWGIKPFSALMGTMKVQDRVIIALDLPALGEG